MGYFVAKEREYFTTDKMIYENKIFMKDKVSEIVYGFLVQKIHDGGGFI